MSSPYVIGQIFGGIGNQLFCYAAARRLAFINKAQLKIDITSGFLNDSFKRVYLLDRFNIKADIANSRESFMERLGPTRRRFIFHANRLLPFNWRSYVSEEMPSLDKRLLNYRVRKSVYLSGYWQNEQYFKDISNMLRKDLKIIMQISDETLTIAHQIRKLNSVSLHIRSYNEVPANHGATVLKSDYYHHAAKLIAARVSDPHFFCFSDCPDGVIHNLCLPYPMTIIRCNHNRGYNGAVEDLWLMSQCHHHIIANSTFSWWGAWLNGEPEQLVVGPSISILPGNREWLPERWIKV